MLEIGQTLAAAVRHHRAGNLSRAEGMYRDVLRREPNHADALHLLGVLARQTGRAEFALESIAKAVVLHNANPDFSFSLANTLRQRGRLDQAISHYQRAIALKPDFAEAHLQLGSALQQQGRLTEALDCFDRGLALEPHDAQARLLRGMIALQMGNLKQGWRDYEWRWVDQQGSTLPWRPYPLWDGSSLAGNTLLLQSEKSLCDQIMFASCWPQIIAQARGAVAQCDPRLISLFNRSFPTTMLQTTGIAKERAGELPNEKHDWGIDARIAAGSVPRYLRPDFESFPRHRGYLVADAQLRQQFWSRLQTLGPGLKVGIAWRGLKQNPPETRCTCLSDWARVLKVPGVQMISLQAGDCSGELRQLRAASGIRVHAWPDIHHPQNLDALTALIAALDLVITVPHVTAHLAGALGVEVWTLLAHWSSWRWFLNRDDSPWYPSMKLFRQSLSGGWPALFDHLELALVDRVKG